MPELYSVACDVGSLISSLPISSEILIFIAFPI
jgi:hypothetical protein